MEEKQRLNKYLQVDSELSSNFACTQRAPLGDVQDKLELMRGGVVECVHIFQVSENNEKGKFFRFIFCMVKYRQISEFTWVSKGLVSPRPYP